MTKRNEGHRAQSVEQLEAQVVQLDQEIFALRNELAMNRKLDKPHLIKAKRKDKARLLTILTEKQSARGVHGVS